MSTDQQTSIDPAAEQAAARNKEIAALGKLVQTGEMSIDNVSPGKREDVRKYLEDGARGMTPQQFHARQNAERMKFLRELSAKGFTAYRASQQDHDFIFGSILNRVDSGVKPVVKPLLREYGERQGYAPEWAERVATRRQPKKVGRSLRAEQHHPVIRDLKGVHMFTQTHQSALKNATYSGLAELLFSGSQFARERQAMQDRLAALEARLALAEADADRANARLDIKDAGIDWREKARAILAAEPGISRRELAVRIGRSHTTVNKYIAEMRAKGAEVLAAA